MAEATNPERPLKRMKAEMKTPKTAMDSTVSTGSTDDIPSIDLWHFWNKRWEHINGLIRSHVHRNHGDGTNLEFEATGDGAQVEPILVHEELN